MNGSMKEITDTVAKVNQRMPSAGELYSVARAGKEIASAVKSCRVTNFINITVIAIFLVLVAVNVYFTMNISKDIEKNSYVIQRALYDKDGYGVLAGSQAQRPASK